MQEHRQSSSGWAVVQPQLLSLCIELTEIKPFYVPPAQPYCLETMTNKDRMGEVQTTRVTPGVYTVTVALEERPFVIGTVCLSSLLEMYVKFYLFVLLLRGFFGSFFILLKHLYWNTAARYGWTSRGRNRRHGEKANSGQALLHAFRLHVIARWLTQLCSA